MLTKERAYALIETVVKASRFETVVMMKNKELGLTRFANSEIHQNMTSSDTDVSIMVFDGEKMASVNTNVLTDEALLAALNSAELKLPLLQPSGMSFEPLKDVPAIEIDDRDMAFETLWDIEARAAAIATHINGLADGLIGSGAFEVAHDTYVWGNSHGVRRFSGGSSAHLEVMVSHGSGASGFSDVLVKKAADLDVAGSFKFAVDKALAGTEAVSLEPGDYDVVLEPLAVNDLMSFISYLGAGSKFHQDGISPFMGKMGECVATAEFSLTDDVNHPDVMGLEFDLEGYPKQTLPIIEQGVFKGIAYDTHTAKLAGAKTTGHSGGYKGEGGMALNAVVAPGNDSLEGLIAATPKGLLVSRFHYMNVVDPRTGTLTALTRDGLFLIEDGKVVSPVKNLRFTDDIPRILKAITGITKERISAPSFFGTNLVPALKVQAFHFTGKTEI